MDRTIENLGLCAYCGEEPAVEKNREGNLCASCQLNYDENGNKTGYCSLDCCVTGRCDQSC